ncbi:hypothetical protein [Polymorphobacter fuscus]|uniref:Uncharacterized protein n=1 Tax=Sandarakinorhabdus fusca TaxID=1439888 RepID=A0A7C9GUF6_9SPHN|nr:hypothetical protein [Polymorphobacter fuscus]KAB7647638.1 hypothetical protein F9290_06565 [Polymorphobacter fuscus]MQT16918.1 hypothetical protein [Polymorphobacter fuscus]NJC09092.1 hypothetical protein [Polymorphobacter fuscus]
MTEPRSKESQADIAARVHDQKQRADAEAPGHAEQASEGTTPGDAGMTSSPRPDYPPSGAFDAEGQRPALERSRKAR